MTKSPESVSGRRADRVRKAHLLLAGAFLVAGGMAIAAPSSKSKTPTIDADFRAAYPMTAPPATGAIAGVDLARLSIPGLRQTARDDRTADDGGIVVSWADTAGEVRVLVHIAVASDSSTARQALDTELHGISVALPKATDNSLGDLAWADDAGKGTALVVATQANVAYSVHVLSPMAGVPSAAAIATQLRSLMVPGVPSFPSATVTLPATLDAKKGGDVRITVPGGFPYQVRADGGYLAHGSSGSIVRPFGPGTVTVYATVVDDLARVTVAKGTAIAK